MGNGVHGHSAYGLSSWELRTTLQEAGWTGAGPWRAALGTTGDKSRSPSIPRGMLTPPLPLPWNRPIFCPQPQSWALSQLGFLPSLIGPTVSKHCLLLSWACLSICRHCLGAVGGLRVGTVQSRSPPSYSRSPPASLGPRC